MKKIAITKELLSIANELDSINLFSEANTLTKIANIVVAEDYKHDPMVYNPDDAAADVQEAHSMDYLDAMEALNKLVESGEINPNELSQIQAILSEDDDVDDEDEDDIRRDKNHKENDGHYFFQDEDDF